MCQSGLMVRMSVNGGTRTAVSAKLIFRANAKGMRKNTRRYSMGGPMISHLPYRASQPPVREFSDAVLARGSCGSMAPPLMRGYLGA